VPSELSPNEFGAQKFRHQPLAEASGMNKGLDGTPKQINQGLQPIARLHPRWTSVRMGSCPTA